MKPVQSGSQRCEHPGQRIGAVVVAYEPDALALACITRLAEEFDKLHIVDNSIRAGVRPPLPAGARLIRMNGNAGISAALNAGISAAAVGGCDAVFVFDQDTGVAPGFAQRMLACRASIGSTPVLLVPDRIDRHVRARARHPVLLGGRVRYRPCAGNEGVMEVAWAVSSGMLLDVALYRRLGPFRDDFFIDHVDTEYCLRARSAGVRVMVSCGETVEHAIGRQERRKIGPWTVRPSHHSAERRYYTARNGLHLALQRGPAANAFRRHHIRYLIHDVVKILLFEDGRIRKLAALARGTAHALARR